MMASVAAGVVSMLFLLVLAALSIGGFAFWLWMLIHAITNQGLADGEKIAWVLVIIFLPFIGSIIYFLIGRNKSSRMLG
jgi:Phospholipase_D-nuclease N-terminal